MDPAGQTQGTFVSTQRPLLHLILTALLVLPAAVMLMWLLGGAGTMPHWYRTGGAAAVAVGVGCAFYPMLRLGPSARRAAWLACAGAAALAPALIPAQAGGLRFAVAVVSLAVGWKLYDLHRSPGCGLGMGFAAYLTYLPNWFWFVCRRPPVPRPVAEDVRRVAVAAPLTAAGVALAGVLFRADWTAVPFLAEHCIKVTVVFFVAVQIGATTAALYRLTGAPAHDATNNPFAARTPADFWRRWNRPVWQWLQQHVFEPLGGRRRLVGATLAAFAASGLFHEYVFGIAAGRVQGWQILFFMVQGCATVATLRVKPRGRAVPLWIAATVAFNLASSLLFFRSVDSIVPFYWRRR